MRIGAAMILYAALAVLMTWPLAQRLGSAMPVGPDNVYVAWSLAWVAHAAAHQPLRLFDANVFHPASDTLLFSDPNVSTGLLLAPLYALGASPALLVDLYFLASFVLCGAAAYLLLRDWTGSDRAGLAGGLLFAFSPLRFTHFDHVQLYALWWTPLALLGLDRFLRGGRAGMLVLATLALAAQAYTSLYLATFAAAALGLEVVLALALGRVRVSWRRLIVGGAAAAAGLAIVCLPLGWAYFSVQRTWAVSRTLEQCIRYSATPFSYLSTVPENVLWGRLLSGFADPVAPWEKHLFPAVAPLVLVVIGARRAAWSWAWRFGVVLALAAMILSLGPYLVWSGGESTGMALPYRLAYDWLPPLRALRAPARWGLVVSLGLSLAAAAAAAELRTSVTALFVAIAVAEAWVRPLPLWGAPPLDGAPAVYSYLASSGRGPVIELPLASDDREAMQRETPRLYYSTIHWRPLANGYSGYTPPPYRALVDLLRGPPSREILSFLTAWDIRTIVLHLGEMRGEEGEAWNRLASSEGLRTGFAEAGDLVLELDAAARDFRPPSARIVAADALVPGRRQSLEIELEAPSPPLALPPGLFGWRRAEAVWVPAVGETKRGWAKLYCPPAIYPGMPERPLFVEAPPREGRYRLELESECFSVSGLVEVR